MLKLTAQRKKWFTLSQDPSGESMVELLYLKPGEVADIESKSSQITGKQFGEDFHTEIDFNLGEKLKTYVLRTVVDWKGFNSVNGKPLACNDVNKLKVMKEFDWFGDTIQEFREEFAEEVEAEEEGAEGN